MSDQMENPLQGRIIESRLNALDFTGVLLRLAETQSDYDTFIAEEVEKLRTLNPDQFAELLALLELIVSQGVIFLIARLSNLTELDKGFGAIPEKLKDQDSGDREIDRANIALQVAQDLLSALKPNS